MPVQCHLTNPVSGMRMGTDPRTHLNAGGHMERGAQGVHLQMSLPVLVSCTLGVMPGLCMAWFDNMDGAQGTTVGWGSHQLSVHFILDRDQAFLFSSPNR